MNSAALDVIGIGNAIVDVIAHSDERFLAEEGFAKGAMTLIDAARAEALYAKMGPAVESSGGSVANTMAGLASLIILARINSAQGDIGEDLTLPAIAAVLVGGTSLFGGSGTVAGTLIGALILTLVLNGMNLLQINASWQPLATGVIVLLAVWIDTRTRQLGE